MRIEAVATVGLVAAAMLSAPVLFGTTASAERASTKTLVSLGATVTGTSVKATTVVKASPATTVSRYGVCVRNSTGANLDYPQRKNVLLTTSGTRFTATKTFAAGTYSYFACLNVNGAWQNVGAAKTFTVGTVAPPTEPPPTEPPPTGTPVPNGPTGAWNLRFQDEFTGTAVNWTKWADHSSAEADQGHGNKGNQQLEWNHGANCGVAGGLLTITAKPANITSSSGVHYDWSSCLLTSAPSYAFRYGYMEIRAKLPAEKGFWPAFWTWQAAGNNQWTETDVYEYYSDNQTRLYLSQHSGSGGGCTLTNLGFNPTQGFHTYGADIKPSGGTDFYIDGRRVCTASGTSTGSTNIIVDMFVYSRIPPNPGTVATKQVDYVRAWQR